MLVAQSLGEYGLFANLGSAIQSGFMHAETFIGDLGTKEYAILIIAVVVLWMWTRRR